MPVSLITFYEQILCGIMSPHALESPAHYFSDWAGVSDQRPRGARGSVITHLTKGGEQIHLPERLRIGGGFELFFVNFEKIL